MRNRRRRRRDGLFHVFVVEVCEKSCDQLKSLPRTLQFQFTRDRFPAQLSLARDLHATLPSIYISEIARTFFPSEMV